MTAKRNTKDGPFCWLSKSALGRIREVAGESNKPSAASVVAVYTALCEIASDSQADSFEACRGHIAGKSCLDVRTVDKAMPILEAAGLLHIERRKLDATMNLPSVYTLLSYGKEIKSPPSDIKPPVAKRCEIEAVTPIIKNLEESEESKESLAPAKPPQRRLLLNDALAAIDGSDPTQVTGSAWGAIGKALKEIKAVSPNVTPDEITRRAENYRQHMPDATISPSALAKHWGKCQHPPRPKCPPQPELQEITE